MKVKLTLSEGFKIEKVVINTILRAKYGSIDKRDRPDLVFVSEFW